MVSKMLAVRRSLRGTEWDGAYLDHFVELMSRLDARRHGFGAADLGSIQAAWAETGQAGTGKAGTGKAGTGKAGWAGGFVATLQDGRVGHVDGDASAAHWSKDAHIEASLSTRKSRARRTSGRQMHWTGIWLVD
jgi:hypothetical protein